MKIDFKQLKGLPVLTQSEIYLGEPINLEINTTDFSVSKIIVRANFFSQQYLIDQSQIIEISDKKIIVSDNVVPSESLITGEIINQPGIDTTTQKNLE